MPLLLSNPNLPISHRYTELLHHKLTVKLVHLHTLAFSCNFPNSLETVLKLYINRTLYLDVSFNATCVELLPSYLKALWTK